MARDSLTALVALNRFGFGARGGASGDFVNAASDPRGFVKAELSRPSSALLEVPGLQPTPVLAKAIFEYQFEQQQARAGREGRARRRNREPATGRSGYQAAAAAQSVALRSRAADIAERSGDADRRQAARSSTRLPRKP